MARRRPTGGLRRAKVAARKAPAAARPRPRLSGTVGNVGSTVKAAVQKGRQAVTQQRGPAATIKRNTAGPRRTRPRI